MSQRGVAVCLPEADCKLRFEELANKLGYELHAIDDISYNVCIHDTNKKSCHTWIKSLGLNCTSEHKFIPDCYKYADIETRRALIEGLINSDGSVRSGRCYIASASEQLIEDIIFVVSSLGGVCSRLKPKNAYYINNGVKHNCKTSYGVSFVLSGLNLSEKHSAKYKSQRKVYKAIETVEDAGYMDCVCIYIDSPDHLYIAGDWVVTHNTITSMMIICDKFKAGIIDSLLVVAPNDVHKQWFDDLCNDESTLSKAIAQEGARNHGLLNVSAEGF